MATYNYGKLVQTAKRLIARFGGPISIVATNTAANPTQGWKAGTAAPATQDAKGVFVNYEQKFVDGTVIRQGDQKVLISAADLTFAPNFVGYIQRGTEKWNVVKIEPLNPGDTMIIYKVQVRR